VQFGPQSTGFLKVVAFVLQKFRKTRIFREMIAVFGTGTDGLPFAKTPQYSDQQPRMLTNRMTHARAWAEGRF
jgi:hypothetical protein